MDILRSGTRPTKKASSEYFTGTVWQDPIVEAPEPAPVRAIRVTFEPAARTAWPNQRSVSLISMRRFCARACEVLAKLTG